MTIRVVAAAAALVLGVATVAAPAMAEPRTVPAPATTTESADTASTTSGTKAKRETRYCAETEITGSRLPRRQCQTREDWLRDGVDPLDYLPR
ncbi:hypothetical protein [Sphingomonas sp. ACRSK]|uniref:hypothetical protein n=1 Tax=Sphingomonas sp. ACRSK TaxID=2918213 RepID=UPI001EF6C854|nr:hypothetical protein [Sphingomonas sp. ACRSK]MCG7348111.1 hypothetical protein [Sphingomonas sp. ACRSK]